jgi:hypothetical protein
MDENGSGFIVHFFSRDTAEHLRRDLTFWALQNLQKAHYRESFFG